MNLPIPEIIPSVSLAGASLPAPVISVSPLLTRLSHWARNYSELVEFDDLCDPRAAQAGRNRDQDDMRPRVWNVPI